MQSSIMNGLLLAPHQLLDLRYASIGCSQYIDWVSRRTIRSSTACLLAFMSTSTKFSLKSPTIARLTMPRATAANSPRLGQ